MNSLILYPNQSGGVCVILPSDELALAEVARKDVPAGVPYLIVPADTIPGDRTFRDAWEADFARPDGFGGDYGIGTHKAVVGYNESGAPILRIEDSIQ